MIIHRREILLSCLDLVFMLDKLWKQVCSTAGYSFAAFLEALASQNLASLSFL